MTKRLALINSETQICENIVMVNDDYLPQANEVLCDTQGEIGFKFDGISWIDTKPPVDQVLQQQAAAVV